MSKFIIDILNNDDLSDTAKCNVIEAYILSHNNKDLPIDKEDEESTKPRSRKNLIEMIIAIVDITSSFSIYKCENHYSISHPQWCVENVNFFESLDKIDDAIVKLYEGVK